MSEYELPCQKAPLFQTEVVIGLVDVLTETCEAEKEKSGCHPCCCQRYKGEIPFFDTKGRRAVLGVRLGTPSYAVVA